MQRLWFLELHPVTTRDCYGSTSISLTTSNMASNSMYIMWGSYYDHLFLHGIVPLVLLGFCYFRISTTMSESSRGSSLRLLSTDNNQMKKDSDDGQPFHTEIFELQNMSNNKQQSVESAQENAFSDECSDPLPVSNQFHSSQANLLSDRTVSITVPTAVGRGEQMTTTEQQDSEEGPAYRKRGPRQACPVSRPRHPADGGAHLPSLPQLEVCGQAVPSYHTG
eukprot:GFUD01104276.1.p1 GENE.GFUD01104276.1~~GFUD01104276.1.p1  ORF type:complete len:222 (-),score=52.19 GFUD01104276.1:469-1134(-)